MNLIPLTKLKREVSADAAKLSRVTPKPYEKIKEEIDAAGGGVDTSGTPVTNDIARFTDADTIEGRSYAELKGDLDLEIGTDVLAEQTIGIADNNLVEIDGADITSGEYAKFTAAGLQSKTFAEVRSDINVADGADVTGSNAPQAHKTAHQNAGGDEISVVGLSGLLADDQHVLDAEVTGVAIAISLLTTRGDIIYRNATVPARLAKGNSGDVLTMGANDPEWSTPSGATKIVAYQTTPQLNLADDTWTKVALDAESFDIAGEFKSRKVTGTADATEASKLHDADGGFESGDVRAGIWNTTDNTYTIVTGFTDSGELSLADDIMVSGETYVLYNARFIVANTGYYVVIGRVMYQQVIANKEYYSGIYVNGSIIRGDKGYTNLIQNVTVATTCLLSLTAADYVELYARHKGGAATVDLFTDNAPTYTSLEIYSL